MLFPIAQLIEIALADGRTFPTQFIRIAREPESELSVETMLIHHLPEQVCAGEVDNLISAPVQYRLDHVQVEIDDLIQFERRRHSQFLPVHCNVHQCGNVIPLRESGGFEYLALGRYATHQIVP
jgi:hypothetical protein